MPTNRCLVPPSNSNAGKDATPPYPDALGLIHVVDILREPGQVDNAKVRAACRPTVRSRLTDIIEARPDVLSTDKVVVLHMTHSTFVTVAPRNMTVVVGGARERGIIERLIPRAGQTNIESLGIR